jgi:hypothetical protein
MASLIVKITGDASGFKGAMSGAEASLDSLSAKAGKVSGSISSLGSAMTVGLTAPILALGAGVIKTASDMEALKMGLASVATASDTTEKQLSRLKEVAKLPGLGFSEAIQGSVRLQSAGFSAQLAERSLKAFGNALATVGKGKADLDGVTLALSQIASKGKISAEEINQLAERVPQIRVAMKAAFGTADTEVLQKAGIGAEEFVTRVVAQLEKLKTVSGGTKNSLENLSDKFKETAERIGSKFLPAVNDVLPRLEKLAGAAADGFDAFTKLPNEIQNTAIALGTVAIAAGPVIKAFEGIRAGLTTVQITAGLAGTAMATLFGAAIIAGIVKTMTAIDDLKAKTKDYYDFLDRMKNGGKQEIIKGQENAGLGGVRVRESFIIPDTGNAAEKFKIDIGAIADELNIFGKKAKAAEEPMRQLGGAIAAVSNTITVSSVGQLVYIESLQRMKTAVEKIKDVMFEYQMQGTETGKKLDYANSVVLSYIDSSGQMSTRLVSNSNDFANLASRSEDYVASLKRVIAEQEKLVANDNVRAMSTATPVGFPKLPTTWTGQDALNQMGIRSEAKIREDISRAEARLAEIQQSNRMGGAGSATGNDVIKAQQHVRDLYKEITGEASKAGKAQAFAMKQVSTVITDLSRGIADVIFKGGKIGDMLVNVAKQAGQAIVRELIEGALTKLASKLLNVGGLFGKVFGGGGSAASSGGGLSGMLGGGSSGGAGSAASSGITGVVGAVAGVVSAVSSVIGNFQFAHMNTALGRIEESTRYVKIWTGEQSQSLLWCAQKSTEYLGYMVKSLDMIGLLNSQMLGKMQAGGAGGTTINMAGAYLLTDSALDDFIERFTRRLKTQGL